MTNTEFWAKRVQPIQPEYADLGEMYRASNRDRGLPAMSEAWVAANGGGNGPIHRPGLYDNTPPKQLGDYASTPKTSLALPKDGESDLAFTHRFDAMVRANLADLPADIVEAATVAYNAAVERLQNGTAHGDSRKSGDGIGITGERQTVRGLEGGVSYRDLQGTRAETMLARQQETRDAESERLAWLRSASRDGYQPLAGEAAATVRQTSRQYAGSQGMFR
jgi:hypothetical protein